ncbi:hypothetical protein Tco_0570053 [Tanacetum coccineum]
MYSSGSGQTTPDNSKKRTNTPDGCGIGVWSGCEDGDMVVMIIVVAHKDDGGVIGWRGRWVAYVWWGRRWHWPEVGGGAGLRRGREEMERKMEAGMSRVISQMMP